MSAVHAAPPARTPSVNAPRLTPSQLRTFDDLLAINLDRPVARPGLVEELTEELEARTAAAVGSWTEKTLWVGKGQLGQAMRCEGLLKAEAAQERDFSTMFGPTMVGIAAHRAIQIAHTHPGLPVAEYVDAAVQAARRNESSFRDSWDNLDIGTQSDLLSEMVSKTVAFLDSWPPLNPKWTPRFEESVQAKVGKLVLSARVDLILGRPRDSGEQTMLLCDLKSGALRDHHEDEAGFYALLSTLRHGVPPFRSMVYSLASGTWTEPDVTEQMLRSALDRVVAGVTSICEVLTEQRLPTLTPDGYCRFCPLAATCEQSSVLAEKQAEAGPADDETPEDELGTSKAMAVDMPAAAPTPEPQADAADDIFALPPE